MLTETSGPFPLYLDEDSVNRALIRALEARGMDVANAVDSGLTGVPDLEQLRHATTEGRVLFLRMSSERSPEDMADQIEFLSRWG